MLESMQAERVAIIAGKRWRVTQISGVNVFLNTSKHNRTVINNIPIPVPQGIANAGAPQAVIPTAPTLLPCLQPVTMSIPV